jgi:hypothetical protein
MSDHVIRAAKFAALLAVAILVAVVVAAGCALLGHEILVQRISPSRLSALAVPT